MNYITKPTLFSRGNKLHISYTYNGKQKRTSLHLDDTKENRREANLKIIPRLMDQINSGKFFKNIEIPIVDEYMNLSFELNKGNRCETTIYGYRKSYDKYIKPIFGEKRLDKITGQDITIWQNNLQAENLAKATIMKIRTILYTMFEDSIETGILNLNPITKAKNLNETVNPKVNRIKLTPFTKNEIYSILESADGQNRNLLATLFYTGIRAGECIGLKWDYVDFENKIISIQGQIINGIEKNILKTKNSRRKIPIINALLPFLEEQFKLTGKQNSYVFLTEKSNKHFHSAGKIREQIWIKVLNKAGIKYRNLHQTRGTFISTLISNGEDINYVSKIAGHENVKITLERYSEYIPTQNKNFGKCFD